MVCSKCSGKGYIMVRVFSGKFECRLVRLSCTKCDGEGEI